MKLMKMFGIGATLLTLLGCTPPVGTPYIKAYHEALSVNGAHLNDDTSPLDQFTELYSDITHPETIERVELLYADNVYFNDTFNTFTNKVDLVNYIKHTQENVIASSTKIVDIANSNNDYYVRWEMNLKAEPKGKPIDTTSMGMTHLRFNDEGKIILHQDYWDAVEALYQHLPYVGGIFRSVRNRL